ncbi:MAG: tetratricopeptide repeat protein [Gammaproteobacteria bacterium]|nr:tetratricopeptide repeat protein [Gammaproteobacteria bacterium]
MTGLLKISASLLLASAMLFSVEAGASATQDFDQGKTYFNAGIYQKAVEYFDRARRRGLKSISLYYNLASSYYKLGDYDNARRYFQAVAEIPKMKALANFNLGLVAKKTGDYDAAKSYFQTVINTSRDQKLVSLANSELDKLAIVSRPKGPERPWTGYASASVGTDSNINIAPEGGLPAEVDDSFMDGYLVLDYMLDGNRRSGWQADAVLFRRNYMDTNLYDEGQVGIGFKKLEQINNWNTYYQLHLDEFTYGGEDYQSILKFEVNGQNKLSVNESYILNYSFENVSSDNAIYDYLDGNRQKIRLEYRIYGSGSNQRYYYEYETNSREDTATISYSPNRHGLRAIYTHFIGRDWSVAGDLGYRLSSYTDPGTTSDRDETRTRAALNLDYRIDKTLKLRTQASVTSNDSDDNNYDYDRTLISVKLSKLF